MQQTAARRFAKNNFELSFGPNGCSLFYPTPVVYISSSTRHTRNLLNMTAATSLSRSLRKSRLGLFLPESRERLRDQRCVRRRKLSSLQPGYYSRQVLEERRRRRLQPSSARSDENRGEAKTCHAAPPPRPPRE